MQIHSFFAAIPIFYTVWWRFQAITMRLPSNWFAISKNELPRKIFCQSSVITWKILKSVIGLKSSEILQNHRNLLKCLKILKNDLRNRWSKILWNLLNPWNLELWRCTLKSMTFIESHLYPFWHSRRLNLFLSISSTVIWTYLSYGFWPHMWATLLTKNAIFRVTQNRKLKFTQNEIHSDSPQK